MSVWYIDRSSAVVVADVTGRMCVGQQRGMEVGLKALCRVRLKSNVILVFTLDRCTTEVWLMYGTAKVENRTKNFRKGNKQRNRAIKRLSRTTPYISSGSNALPIAGGLAQYYQIQYVVAAQKLGRAKFRGCEKSQGVLDSDARQQSVTPSPSEWEGQPPNRATPFLCAPTCHGAGRTWGRRRVGGKSPPCSLRYVPRMVRHGCWQRLHRQTGFIVRIAGLGDAGAKVPRRVG